MPISFTEEEVKNFDPNSNAVKDKVFSYLLESLRINPQELQEEIEKNGTEEFLSSETEDDLKKMAKTLWAFFYGSKELMAEVKNDSGVEVVGSAYKTEKETMLNLMDRLHELHDIHTGNDDLDQAVQLHVKKIIHHFTKSQTLIAQIALEQLTPIVESSRGRIVSAETLEKETGNELGTIVVFTYEPSSEEEESKEEMEEETEKEGERKKVKKEQKKLKFFVKTQDVIIQEKITITDYSDLDSKVSTFEEGKANYSEMMVYKILEHTRFAPKSFFSVYPFAPQAILTATQATNFTKTHLPKSKKFTEAYKFRNSLGFDDEDIIHLNGIDLMSRLCDVGDLTGENYGRALVNNEAELFSTKVKKKKWKIVDLAIKDGAADVQSSIYEDFMAGTNSEFTKFGDESWAQTVMQSSTRQQKQKIAAELVEKLDSRSENGKRLPFIEACDLSLFYLQFHRYSDARSEK